ncbi:MAG: phosphotransferase family protein [Candidatus Thorarchaeota archaeon]|nr:MAG: phosphotransferase family protein [Candidatus Thorarchaeota archaeon]
MDEAKLTSYLSQNLSERNNLRLISISRITEGWETEIYSIDVEHQTDNGRVQEGLILRMYPGAQAAYRAKKEFLLLKGLRRVEYPVPKVFLVEQDTGQLGAPFIVMERIDGQTMGVEFGAADQQNGLQALFAELFVDLHNLEWQEVIRDFDPKPKFEAKDAIDQQLASYEHDLTQYKKEELMPILEWLRARISTVSCKRLSLAHRDFHPFNIIIDETGAPFVIDWTAASITDYRVDLGWTLLLIGAFSGRELRDSVLGAYERVIGAQVDNIEYFEVIAAFRRLLDVSVSLSIDAGERGMKTGAVEMIMESFDHMANVEKLVEEYTGIEISVVNELERSFT